MTLLGDIANVVAVANNVSVDILALILNDSLPTCFLHPKLGVVYLNPMSMTIKQPSLRVDYRQAIQIQIEVNLHTIWCDLDAVHHLARPRILPANKSFRFFTHACWAISSIVPNIFSQPAGLVPEIKNSLSPAHNDLSIIMLFVRRKSKSSDPLTVTL
jgi:hypothetical protein